MGIMESRFLLDLCNWALNTHEMPQHIRPRIKPKNSGLYVASIFSGIGGFELGLRRAGHNLVLACENNPEATTVLRTRFPELRLESDVCALRSIPQGVSLITAGFPCQDLSQAGRTAGIWGTNQDCVWEVFRLIRK